MYRYFGNTYVYINILSEKVFNRYRYLYVYYKNLLLLYLIINYTIYLYKVRMYISAFVFNLSKAFSIF